MIAVAKIGGHQAIVQVGDVIEVDKIDAEAGKKVEFELLLVSEEDGTNFEIGTPFIAGKKAEAKVVEHGKGDKIRIYKMKPRKRYRRTQGHRQEFSVIEILSVGAEKKAAPKAPKAPKAASEKAAPKADKKAE